MNVLKNLRESITNRLRQRGSQASESDDYHNSDSEELLETSYVVVEDGLSDLDSDLYNLLLDDIWKSLEFGKRCSWITIEDFREKYRSAFNTHDLKDGIHLMQRAARQSRAFIISAPLEIGFHLFSRLVDLVSKFDIVKQYSASLLQNDTNLQLLPLKTYWPSPDGPVSFQYAHHLAITSMCPTNDHDLVLFSDQGGFLNLLSKSKGKLIKSYSHRSMNTNTFSNPFSVSEDGRWVSTFKFENVLLFDLHSHMKDQPRLFAGHTDWVTEVEISSDGRFIASASLDKTVRLWDTDSKSGKAKILQLDDKSFLNAKISNGRWVIAKSLERRISLWDMHADYRKPQIFYMHNKFGEKFTSAVISKDGRWITCRYAHGTIGVLDVEKAYSSAQIRELKADGTTPLSLFISSNSRWIISQCQNNTVQLWDLHSEDVSSTWVTNSHRELSGDLISYEILSESNSITITTCKNQFITELQMDLRRKESSSSNVSFKETSKDDSPNDHSGEKRGFVVSSDNSADARWILTGHEGGMVCLWDTNCEKSARCVFYVQFEKRFPSYVGMSINQRWVFCSTNSEERTVSIWDKCSDDPLQGTFTIRWQNFASIIDTKMAISTDGRWFVVFYCVDYGSFVVVEIRDARNGRIRSLLFLDGEENSSRPAVQFSESGRLVVMKKFKLGVISPEGHLQAEDGSIVKLTTHSLKSFPSSFRSYFEYQYLSDHVSNSKSYYVEAIAAEEQNARKLSIFFQHQSGNKETAAKDFLIMDATAKESPCTDRSEKQKYNQLYDNIPSFMRTEENSIIYNEYSETLIIIAGNMSEPFCCREKHVQKRVRISNFIDFHSNLVGTDYSNLPVDKSLFNCYKQSGGRIKMLNSVRHMDKFSDGIFIGLSSEESIPDRDERSIKIEFEFMDVDPEEDTLQSIVQSIISEPQNEDPILATFRSIRSVLQSLESGLRRRVVEEDSYIETDSSFGEKGFSSGEKDSSSSVDHKGNPPIRLTITVILEIESLTPLGLSILFWILPLDHGSEMSLTAMNAIMQKMKLHNCFAEKVTGLEGIGDPTNLVIPISWAYDYGLSHSFITKHSVFGDEGICIAMNGTTNHAVATQNFRSFLPVHGTAGGGRRKKIKEELYIDVREDNRSCDSLDSRYRLIYRHLAVSKRLKFKSITPTVNVPGFSVPVTFERASNESSEDGRVLKRLPIISLNYFSTIPMICPSYNFLFHRLKWLESVLKENGLFPKGSNTRFLELLTQETMEDFECVRLFDKSNCKIPKATLKRTNCQQFIENGRYHVVMIEKDNERYIYHSFSGLLEEDKETVAVDEYSILPEFRDDMETVSISIGGKGQWSSSS